MSGNLKAELKAALLAATQSQGMPPTIDKTINSIWEQFKKSQPMKLAEKGLDDAWKDKVKIWEEMTFCIEKFGVPKKVCAIAIKKLQAKYGENPTDTEIRLMVT